MNPEEKTRLKTVLKIVAAVVILFMLILLHPCVIIGAGERGVVLNWGAVAETTMEEGLHFRMPIQQDIKKIDVQTQKLEIKTDSYSKDIQPVTTTLALNYHIKPDIANKLYQEVGMSYSSRLIDPAVQESVKAAAALFTAQELVSERPKVKEEIKSELNSRLSNYFAIDEFSITDFVFSDQFEKAIEEKQVAQQTALKAENDLKRIQIEAEQRIAQAKAEAEAIRIQAQAVTQQGGKDYVQLKAIEKWNGRLPDQMIPGGTVPFLNLTK